MQFSFAGRGGFLLAFAPGGSYGVKTRSALPGRSRTGHLPSAASGSGERRTIREDGPYIVVRMFLQGHLGEVSLRTGGWDSQCSRFPSIRPQFTAGGFGSLASQGTGWRFSSFPFKNITPGQYAPTGGEVFNRTGPHGTGPGRSPAGRERKDFPVPPYPGS